MLKDSRDVMANGGLTKNCAGTSKSEIFFCHVIASGRLTLKKRCTVDIFLINKIVRPL